MQFRPALVLFHRYAGLAMAVVLLVAALTGSLLAWNDEFEALTNPSLFRVSAPTPDTPTLDPLALRARVAALYPKALVLKAPLHVEWGRSISFFIEAAPDEVAGQTPPLDNDQIFIDPYTGALLGERKWGDPRQGVKNLMPFIYRVHDSLAMGTAGTIAFGIVAMMWTINCLVGASLTFPAAKRKNEGRESDAKNWIARWRPSWKVRWVSGGYKLKFDLHRASGLWLWVPQLAVAWSAVGFNIPQVYHPIMKAIFARQAELAAISSAPLDGRRFDWMKARETGRRLMAEQSSRHGFDVLQEDSLQLDAVRGRFCYVVRSSLDIRERIGQTRTCFDADSGQSRGIWMPTGAARGDTVTTWLASFHMAALWGVPLKIFTSILGLAVAGICITGVLIWARKRQGRAGRAGRL